MMFDSDCMLNFTLVTKKPVSFATACIHSRPSCPSTMMMNSSARFVSGFTTAFSI